MIELSWPPASLSGHNNGSWHGKSPTVKKHREWAKLATQAAKLSVPDAGDIRVVMTFYPPDKRGDRINFPIRAKPLFDGIADGLGVNDSRFLPVYLFGEPVRGGKIIVVVGQ